MADRQLKAPCRAFVFNSVGNQWIERGTGVLRVFRKPETGRVVVEMRQEKTSKILVSFQVEPKTQLEPSADSTTAWVFKVRGHKVGSAAAKDEVLALQFGTTQVAKEFQSLHAWGQQENVKPAPAADDNRLFTAPQTGAAKTNQRRLTIDGAKTAGLDLEALANGIEDLELEDSGAGKKTAGASGGAAASNSAKPTPTHGVKCHKGLSKKGYAEDRRMKPYNQDRLVMEHDPKTGAWCFCVFDGHGEAGHEVSAYCKARISQRTFAHPEFPDRPAKALGESILNIEREMLRSGRIDCRLSGTTAVMSIIYNGVITCANIGDSRLIRATLQGPAARKPEILKGFDISNDHKPDLPAEKERIEKNGGLVYAIDYGDDLPSPARVWLKEAALPGLAMSRSVGDTVGKAAGVISTPEITSHTLTDADRYLIIASDGLWEFIETDECIQLVQKWLKQNNKTSPCETVPYLYKESKRRWLENETVTDDTTICVIEVGRLR